MIPARRLSIPGNRIRTPHVAVVLAALLWVAAIAGALVLIARDAGGGPQAALLPEAVCKGPQIGVHSTLAFEGDPERRAAVVVATRELLGARVVRDSLLWNQIEPREGRRDWSRTDSIVEELRAAAIEPLLVVVGSPPWANGLSGSRPGHYLHVPGRGPELGAWLRDYSDFLTAAVHRYHDYVRRWEIWNEPNLAAFWRPQPDPIVYRRVYETLRTTILQVDPTAEVAVGGLAGLTAAGPTNISGSMFLRSFMSTEPPIDAVAIHPYSTNDHPPGLHIPGENNFDDIGRVRAQLAAEGTRVPIWVTEWGWSSATVGERRQARYVRRSLAMLEHRYRFVRVATYFADHDRPPDFFQGLLDSKLEPKPAALPFRRYADRSASDCHKRRDRRQPRQRQRAGGGSPATP